MGAVVAAAPRQRCTGAIALVLTNVACGSLVRGQRLQAGSHVCVFAACDRGGGLRQRHGAAAVGTAAARGLRVGAIVLIVTNGACGSFLMRQRLQAGSHVCVFVYDVAMRSWGRLAPPPRGNNAPVQSR